MAVYKVIQDIEAEDKLLGPLTLKSFIYAGIAGVLIFIEFRLLVSGLPPLMRLPIVILLLLPTALFGVLASPLGHDQPTEIWLLSHVRFLLKPHQRVWDQRDSNNTVTITAPKVVSRQLTKGFSQTEVQSRLQALATTLDSHGWAIKNSAVSLDDQSSYLNGSNGDSDRLVGASTLSQPGPVIDVHANDDILDEQNNATAQHFNELMQAADAQRKQEIIKKIDAARQTGAAIAGSVDSRFLDSSAPSSGGDTTFVGKAVVAPKTDDSDEPDGDSQEITAEDRALLDKWHKRDAEIHRRSASFHSKLKPEPPTPPPVPPTPAIPTVPEPTKEDKQRQDAMTAADKADKLELSQSGNDLTVASIAHLANRKASVEQVSPNEIVISLH